MFTDMKSVLLSLATAALLLTALPIRAHDVDLFTLGTNGIEAPNILFMVDNSANWNANSQGVTKEQIVHEALYKFLDAIKPDIATKQFNFGIMVFAQGNSPRGGLVYEHFSMLDSVADVEAVQSRLYCDPDNFSGRGAAANLLLCQTQLGMEWDDPLFNDTLFYGSEFLPKTNNAPYATMFNEALLYYGGEAPASGTQDGVWATNNEEGYDAAAVSLGSYVSPMYEGSCAKSYNILLGNGGPDSGENSSAETYLTNLGGVFGSDPLSLSPSNFESNWGDEYARYLADNDVNDNVSGSQTLTTYVLDVFDTTAAQNGPARAAHAFLENIATQGNGNYYAASNVDEVVDSLLAALNEILAVNSVFASTSLPVSVNVRGTSLNQVYMGVFRPRDTQQWTGNLKLYQLGIDSNGNVELVDADGDSAEDSSSGFVRLDARSFWTEDSTYWDWTTTTDGRDQDSDNPDGKEVERGGSAQILRDTTAASRVIYTCNPANCNSFTDFDTGNGQISQSDLGAADSTERSNIINWTRGVDIKDDNGDGDTTDTRAYVHGDVVHSEPVVINYGSAGTYVFYGANDGIFRAVDGGTDEGVSSTDGQEVWGFVAPEFYSGLKEIYDNDAHVTTANFDDKEYFFDGIAGAYVQSDADGDVTEAYLYVTVRRGGRFMYAFDVTDPENPDILWKIDNTDSGYSEMGQTWSRPIVTDMNINGASTPVVIMGMGYDPAVDDVNSGTNSMGRGVAVIDAEDGHLIWQVGPSPSGGDSTLTEADMIYSIPSDVGALDRDSDGFADRFYVGDTGAQLWRMDVGDPDPDNWEVFKLLEARTAAQKFLQMPIVVAAPDGSYDAVILGTGDREDPLDGSEQDYFIVYKDYDQAVGPSSSAGPLDLTSDLLEVEPGTTDLTGLSASDQAKFNAGWYMEFEVGEKIVGRALTFNEVSIFNTHQPSGGVGCDELGTSRRYSLNPFLAQGVLDNDALYEEVSGGGLIPDPVVAIVELENEDGEMVLTPVFCTGPDCGTVPNVTFGVREPIYWYLNRDD